MLKELIDSLRTVVSTANDRMHVMHAQGHITLPELLAVQYEISAACDHLELASDLADAIDNQIETPNHPDNNDRDAGRICEQCNHDLELNADFRCVRCGA